MGHVWGSLFRTRAHGVGLGAGLYVGLTLSVMAGGTVGVHYAQAPHVKVPASCTYATFTNALWSSKPYSIVEIGGEMYFAETVEMPEWPLLITGPTNGYAVIHSRAEIGAFTLNQGQTDHTRIRNVYLALDGKSSFQAGFWLGGVLPWSSESAGASFENVRLRMCNPGVLYYGWHVYGGTNAPVVISNCTINALGATEVLAFNADVTPGKIITRGLRCVNMPGDPSSPRMSASGCPARDKFESSHDSDGDGLNDFEEVTRYGTDPYLKDSDGDGVSDPEEIRRGADPTDQSVYCFRLTVALTNAYAEFGSLKMAFYEGTTGKRVSTVVETSNRVDEVVLRGLVNAAGKPLLRLWGADEKSSVSIPYSLHGPDGRIVLQSSWIASLYDADGDGLPDAWEMARGLSPRTADDALEDPDGDGLINLHEYWASAAPKAFDATNTVLSLCARSVDARLAGKNPTKSLRKFDDYVEKGPRAARNADFWAKDVDTSCASFWNSATKDYWGGGSSPWHKAGTAVSKRHIITAWHYAIPLETTVWFMGNDGVPCSRIVKGCRSVGGDICIQSLDRDLPDGVVPARILPENYADYIRTAERLPVVTFDQEEKLIVADAAALPAFSDRGVASGASRPQDATRRSFYEDVVTGDSGNPRFLVLGNRLILLSVMHFGGTGAGCFVTHYRHEIQQAMDALCPGYELEAVDLKAYPRLKP